MLGDRVVVRRLEIESVQEVSCIPRRPIGLRIPRWSAR
jgi:hypothetical protein